MAYTAGDKILNDHYNTFISGTISGVTDHNVANINSLWGVGQASKGYGQSTILPTATAGVTVVTATQWTTLLSRMFTINQHTGSAVITPTPPNTGDLITALAPIAGNITTLDAARLSSGVNGGFISAQAAGSASWTTTSVHTFQVQFPSADAARYFFNAGGYIDLSFDRAGGTVTQKNTDWTNLLNDAGIIRLTAFGVEKVGGTGSYGGGTTDIIYNNGYYNWVNAGGSRVFRQFASGSVYTSNSIDIFAITNGTQGVNQDNGDLVTFEITMSDSAGDPPPVDGTITAFATLRLPETTYLPEAPWGVPVYTINSTSQA